MAAPPAAIERAFGINNIKTHIPLILDLNDHILNILPSTAIQKQIPYTVLFKKSPDYKHLRVFGCLCFPNLNYSHLNKLAPRSTPCLFLGYPSQHRGYRCLDLKTNKIIISRHVIFDEDVFPAAQKQPNTKPPYTFLDSQEDTSPVLKSILQSPLQTPIPHTQTVPIPAQQSLPAPPPAPTSHPMMKRAKSGVHKPKQIFSLHTKAISPFPKSHIQALSDPN